MTIFYAYVVQRKKEYELITLAETSDFRALDFMSSYDTKELSLNPRYKILQHNVLMKLMWLLPLCLSIYVYDQTYGSSSVL